MQRVLGIGGYFLRARDPEALTAWYRENLGLDTDENGLWQPEPGPTVMATFAADSDDVQDVEGVGRFGWVTDPEGNRLELWQPA